MRFSVSNPEGDSTSLWEASADGNQLHPLLSSWNEPPAECCGNWTPDGNYFVFQSRRRGRSDLWLIRENEGHFRRRHPEPMQLTTGPLNFDSPTASLDGKRLFVVGSLPRGELVRYDTQSNEFLPYLSGISAEGVDFSRNGQWVTYVTIPGSVLWRSRVDGSQRLQLTSPPMMAFQPRWSPDGKWIAFEAQLPGGTWKIYVVSAEGGSLQQLTAGERNEGDAYWSPDAKSLIFSSKPFIEGMATAKTAIYLLDINLNSEVGP